MRQTTIYEHEQHEDQTAIQDHLDIERHDEADDENG